MIGAVFLLSALSIILLAIGWLIGGAFGISIALILAVLINISAYWYSDKIVLRAYAAQPLEDEKIKKIVASLCQEAKLPLPKLYLVKKKVPNAFATGRNPKHASVAVLGLILIVIFAPIAALVIRAAISQSREYHADFTGTLMTKKPHALANALKKISQVAKTSPIVGPASTGNLWIVNPFHADWFTNLFSTHPPIEKRIKRLEDLEIEQLKK